jgi:hypothetical protein
MRTITRVLASLAVLSSVACGTYDPFVAPPSIELNFAVSLDPEATGGMRASTTVTASLFLDETWRDAYVDGRLESAEFTVYDDAFRVLTRRVVEERRGFTRDGRLSVGQTLDWEPTDALGRVLTVRLVLAGHGAPEEPARVIERAITF